MNLKNKVILVTGGSGLLGRAMIQHIREHEGTAINGDIAVENNIEQGTIHLDITDSESIAAGVKSIIKQYGRIDGLVNNAYPRTADWGNRFEDVTLESWRENVDGQLNRVFEISQLVLEQMKNNKIKGAVVNIASIYGVLGNDFTVYEGTDLTSPAAYAAIKGGVVNFTRYLAAYYGPHNIRVNCVSPGGIFNHQPEPFVRNYEKKVPLKRMGKPEDIAPAVSFLLSDAAAYVTGHNLMVDGGWSVV